MARVVAMINMKGGVGKTTLAVNLAWCLADWAKKKVLVIDLDPQFNASQYMLGYKGYTQIQKTKHPTILDVFQGKPISTTIISITNIYEGKLDLIPSWFQLSDVLFAGENISQYIDNFRDGVKNVQHEYDLVMIDCPPTESPLTIAAYHVSDFIIVPIKLDYLSTIGLPLLKQSINRFQEQHNTNKPKFGGIIQIECEYLGKNNEQGDAKDRVMKYARANGWRILKTSIPYTRTAPRSSREGTPIYRSTYVNWSRVKAIQQLKDELIEVIGL